MVIRAGAGAAAGMTRTVEQLLRDSGLRVKCSASLVTVRDVLGGAARRDRAESRAREAAAARTQAL